MTKPYFEPLIVAGERVDFAHLEPFKFIVSTKHRPDGVVIGVRFSNHCFSDKFHATRHSTEATVVWDRQQRRVFSHSRYGQSFRLRDIIEGLPTADVFYTPEANFVRIVSAGAEGTLEYRVYFRVKKDPGEECDVKLFVESAYSPEDGKRKQTPMHMTRVRFALLIDKTLRGEALKFHYKK